MSPSHSLFERPAILGRGAPRSELGSLALLAAGIAATFAATLGLVWVFLLLTF